MSRYALPDPHCRISAGSICQDPLQNSCARSMRRDLYKIHVSEPLYRNHVCGASTEYSCARSMRQDLYRIQGCGPATRSMSQDPLQDLCPQIRSWKIHASVRIHVSVSICAKRHISGPMSQHPFLWALCKIQVSGSSIEDRCFGIHVSASMSLGPYIRSMSQDPLQDRCFRIPVAACGSSTKPMFQDPLQAPCLRTHYTIHVSGSMSPNLLLSL